MNALVRRRLRGRARVVATVIAATLFSAWVPLRAAAAAPPSNRAATPSAAPSPNALGALFVRGAVLSVGGGYIVFTTGDALRVRSGTPIPRVTIGSSVRVTLDRAGGDVTEIQRAPQGDVPGDIDAGNVPRTYVAVSARSAPRPAPPEAAGGRVADKLVSVTIDVTVPGNTPPSDDVFLATDRSNYGPAEIRMQRVSARTFTTSLSLARGTRLKYQFTRGNFATVERERSGGLVTPRSLDVTRGARAADTILRWADIS